MRDQVTNGFHGWTSRTLKDTYCASRGCNAIGNVLSLGVRAAALLLEPFKSELITVANVRV